MGPKPTLPSSGDLYRSRLDQILDQRHELFRLASLIDWDGFDQEFGRFYGTVAVTWARLNEPGRTGHSGCKTEELIDETDFAYRLMFPLDAMTAADHPHDFKALQGRDGGFHRLEATCR